MQFFRLYIDLNRNLSTIKIITNLIYNKYIIQIQTHNKSAWNINKCYNNNSHELILEWFRLVE